MLLIAVMIVAAPLGVSSTRPRCEATRLMSVAKDDDRGDPFVLAAANGRRIRMLGNDFIFPDRWRRGERLRICRMDDVHPEYRVTDVTRGETTIGIDPEG